MPENIRIKFRKTGNLKYISHLDICRTMTPAMIRAGIPIWYTEGFNPHPKMVFTQPLPLFAESVCEYLDIKIVENMPCDEIKERLNRALAKELAVSEVYTPVSKFTEIQYAVYMIKGLGDIASKELEFLLAGSLEAQKRAKNGEEKTVNIRPMVKSVEVCDGGLKCVLDASGASYLNPDVFCKSVIKKLGLDGQADFSIMRLGWLKADGTEFK